MASAGSGDETAAAAAAAMVTLISSDSERFEVAEAAATPSQTIRHMIEDGCTDGGVPLPNVTGKILAKVIEYCNKHALATTARASAAGGEGSSSSSAAEGSSSSAAAVASKEELKVFDDALVDVDRATLFHLILAANYLDIRGLMDITCQKVADLIKHMSPEEAREMFNIKNDLTPEEEEEVCKENAWAFE